MREMALLGLLTMMLATATACEGTMEGSWDGVEQANEQEPAGAPATGTATTTPTPTSTAGGGGATNGGSTTGERAAEPVCPSAECGEPLYELHCVTCHGPDGAGTPTWPGSVAGFGDTAPVVKQGQGDMAAIPILDDDEIESIQFYLDSLADPDPTTWTADDVYARRCAGCHGVDGEGTARGYQIQQPMDGFFESVVRNGISRREYAAPMPGFSGADVTDAQLTGMKAKLRSYTLPAAGQEQYEVFCANCHGVAANGGAHQQGLLWVKNFPSSAFYGDVRNGHHLGEYTNLEFMPAYSASLISDADIDAMVAYIKTSL